MQLKKPDENVTATKFNECVIGILHTTLETLHSTQKLLGLSNDRLMQFNRFRFRFLLSYIHVEQFDAE